MVARPSLPFPLLQRRWSLLGGRWALNAGYPDSSVSAAVELLLGTNSQTQVFRAMRAATTASPAASSSSESRSNSGAPTADRSIT
uniref:Uncharacterized protein n=1 Tax=Mycena chlorophos TaxID=658473 RepID=A0ABQ0L9G6_MYCCL|nr:predicted protein [Mycena chlorophos]